MVRPRGTVALVGMPGKVTIDLAPLWHREVRLAGAYAYGTESVAPATASAGVGAGGGPGGGAGTAGAAGAAGATRRKKTAAQPKEVPTFQLAFEVVAAQSTGCLVSATYPLTRFEEAVAHAGAAGRRGAVKIAFDITKGHTR
jgi:hypothetical protein